MGRKEDGLSEHVSEAAEALPELMQARDKMQADLQVMNQKVNALIGYISAFIKPGAPPVLIKMTNGGHIQIGSNSVIQPPPPGVQLPPNIQALMTAAMGQLSTPAHVAPTPAPAQTTASGRAPKGQVYGHVDAVISAGGRHTLKTLKRDLLNRFQHTYGTSSIHRAVIKGIAEKKYKVDGNEYYKA